MSNATEHALEQAERIVQYSKYSDRFLVVEGDYVAERRAFVKLVSQKLPPQVRPVVVRADGAGDLATVIERLGTTLQLSAGIETPEQLVTATTAALGDQERLLLVVENAEQWLDSDAADSLYELIDQAHELARERLLFMLVGDTGLCTRIETAQPLAAIIADLHCIRLLGTAPADDASSAAPVSDPTPDEAAATAPATTAEARASGPRPTGVRPARRGASLWTHPPFLIAAAISVAVITIGIFALMSRSTSPTSPDDVALTLDRESDQPDGERQASADDGADPATPSPESDGTPRHVPFPEADSEPETPTTDTPATTEEASSTADRDDDARTADETATTSADESTRPEQPETATNDDEATETQTTSDSAVDNDWFADQPRARATIQLAAFGSLDGARDMIRSRSGDALPAGDWRIYTQRIDDRTLYTVTYGDFASVERARHAMESLPEDLRAVDPYPRSVGDIQDRLVD
ncbi:MAG: SPOR domain-containing protein [Guyparkeria sp.]